LAGDSAQHGVFWLRERYDFDAQRADASHVPMKTEPKIQCLLWDFGDTLCNERFIWGSAPEWTDVYRTIDSDGVAARWCTGDLCTGEFTAILARRMDLPRESIMRHLRDCCRAIEFFEETFRFFRSRHLPQAIVTVNPDLFSEVIVPVHGLDRYSDAIVTSWEEGTDDKRILNRTAIERLGVHCDSASALLIDNKEANIDAWLSVGGAGYLHLGDAAFARDVQRGIDAIAARRR
jgi:phosphoglycolate phosphatase-like HAD superfamily hydrolase